MLEEDMEVAIKVVVVGNGAVGKSSMIQRYCKGIFTKDYKKTIGVDFLERQIQYVLNRCHNIDFFNFLSIPLFCCNPKTCEGLKDKACCF